MQPVLQVKNIAKEFPGVKALEDISIDFYPGECHALVGENGAGKTTLMKVLFGLETPQEGKVLINGEPAKIENTLDAISKGIGMVHQHLMLVPSLTVAENVVHGIEPMKNGQFDF